MRSTAVLSTMVATAAAQQGYTAGPTCSPYVGSFDLTTLQTEAIVLVGKPNIRCTEASRDRLDGAEVCYTFVDATADADLYRYMKCIHPNTNMHSFVYMGGQYVGDGFFVGLADRNDWRCQRVDPNDATAHVWCLGDQDFDARIAAAGGETTCGVDCSHILDTESPPRFPGIFNQEIADYPVALFGWAGCPCTGNARDHFQSEEYCYMENVWADPSDSLFAYLQCRYGAEHHSFIFVNGQFLGNGFDFDVNNPRARYGGSRGVANGAFEALASAAGARTSCPFVGLENLRGGDLQSCTQNNDRRATGWTRTGSCNWDARDGGYHEVCVEMSHDFMVSSTENDGNDLSSVVSQGGHWCICAWAFASAVTRDPGNDHPQGITLECDATNGKLRDVYTHFATLRSPSGATYRSQVALELVERLCPQGSESSASVDIEEAVDGSVTVTGDNLAALPAQHSATSPCYQLDSGTGTLTFPAWQSSCPNPHPLPSNCPEACEPVYAAWWTRCHSDSFITGIDASLHGGLAAFAAMCKAH